MATREPHPSYADVLARCRSRPDATEDRFLGETVFRVRGRVFAFIGRPNRAAVTVKLPNHDAERLVRLPYARRARYVGRFGWLTVEIRDEESLGVALDAVDRSHQLAASRPIESRDRDT
jgi:predicted DNA-binding protein (MmcQ/YjbR family)